MRIGLTYDLRSEHALGPGHPPDALGEFDSEDTIRALAETIEALGHEVVRIGSGLELARRLAAGERPDLVFNICEGLRGRSREAQVPALLELYHVPYTFSDPLTAALALDKEMTKRIVRDAGLATPACFIMTRADTPVPDQMRFPLFLKPVAEGTAKGIDGSSRATDTRALRERCAALLERYRQPVLVEEFLPGREVTVGILGSGSCAQAIGAVEVILRDEAEPEAYTFRNKEECESLVEYRSLPPCDLRREAERTALAAYRALQCLDAGRVDLRCDAEGRPQFLEINPLPGLDPTHSDLPILASQAGMSYRALIGEIIRSAGMRYGLDI